MGTPDDTTYLQHDHLLLLRQAWQGRLTREATSKGPWVVHRDSRPLSDIDQIKVEWLLHEGYLDNPSARRGDEWVILSPTEKGAAVLESNRMHHEQFHDMSLPEAWTIQKRLDSNT